MYLDELPRFFRLATRLDSRGNYATGWQGIHQGVPYRYLFRDADASDYICLHICVRAAPGMKVRVERSDAANLAADSQPEHRVDIGQAGALTREAVAEPSRRAAMSELFARGFDRICSDGVCIEAVRDRLSLAHNPDPDLITCAVEHLATLSGDAAASSEESASLTTHVFTRTNGDPVESGLHTDNLMLVVLAASVMVLGFYTFDRFAAIAFAPTSPWLLFAYTLCLSIPAIVWVTWKLVRRAKTRLVSRFGLRASLILTIFVLPFAVYDAIATANAALDPHGEAVHEATVLHTQQTRSLWNLFPRSKSYRQKKEALNYAVFVQSWRDPQTTVKIPVTRDTYQKIVGNRSLEITTGSGLFGVEWVKSVAPHGKAAAGK